MSESNNSLLDLFAKIVAVIGFFVTLVAFINELREFTADPSQLRVASVAGFIAFFVSVIWLAFRATTVSPKWRWASLGFLYVGSIAYFFWAGTWTGPSEQWPQDRTAFPIERASVRAFLYEGVNEPEVGQGTGWLTTMSTLTDNEFTTSYELEYSLPRDGDAYAGVSLWFPEPQDLTRYDFIELTIRFGDEQSRCRLFIKDSFGGQDFVLLGDGNVVEAKIEEQTIQVPIQTYFAGIARSSIREIVLDVNNEFVQGSHSFTVSSIKFRE